MLSKNVFENTVQAHNVCLTRYGQNSSFVLVNFKNAFCSAKWRYLRQPKRNSNKTCNF